MPLKFAHPLEWVSFIKRHIQSRDLDNVVLLSGDPGNGKSTVMYQIAKALSPSFNIDRIHFTIQEFLADARERKPGEVVTADEIFLHRRHSAKRDVKDVIDFLQICRGLNLHILICFPHADMMDRAVLDHRFRYRIDIPEQGLANMYEAVRKRITNGHGEETVVINWILVCTWRFYENKGPEWDEYRAKKLTKARQRDAEARGYKDEHEAENEDYEAFLASKGLRKGRRKGTTTPLKTPGAPPKFLMRANRIHPVDCGTQSECPTGIHHAKLPEN